MKWLSRWFPAGMRGRWWAYRLIDWIVALTPAPRAKAGALLIRIDGIGDLAVYRAVLDHWPQVLGLERKDITILGSKSWGALVGEIFEGFNLILIDDLAVEKKFFYRLKIAQQLRKGGWKIVICDRHRRKTLSSDALMLWTGAPEKIAIAPFVTAKTQNEFDWYSQAMSKVIDTGSENIFELERNFIFLEELAGRPIPRTPTHIPWRSTPKCALPPQPYLALVIGSNEPGRRWPLAYYLEIARRAEAVGVAPVFLGGGKELYAKGDIAAAGLAKAIDLIGVHDLAGSTDVLRHAQAVLANDTGLMHLAMALRTPTIGLVGGGDFGFIVPYPPEYVPLRSQFLWQPMECYHCAWHCHKRDHDRQPFPCVAEISVERAWAALAPLLARPS